jgi:hypothetical protein
MPRSINNRPQPRAYGLARPAPRRVLHVHCCAAQRAPYSRAVQVEQFSNRLLAQVRHEQPDSEAKRFEISSGYGLVCTTFLTRLLFRQSLSSRSTSKNILWRSCHDFKSWCKRESLHYIAFSEPTLEDSITWLARWRKNRWKTSDRDELRLGASLRVRLRDRRRTRAALRPSRSQSDTNSASIARRS